MKIEKRTRQLANGKWVCEVRKPFLFLFGRWEAIDMQHPQFAWEPNDRCWSDCFASSESEALEKAKEHIALRFGA